MGAGGFQFLIGTVKIVNRQEAMNLAELFQFLIGTVKIKDMFLNLKAQGWVSIPYRYCKNAYLSSMTDCQA